LKPNRGRCLLDPIGKTAVKSKIQFPHEHFETGTIIGEVKPLGRQIGRDESFRHTNRKSLWGRVRLDCENRQIHVFARIRSLRSGSRFRESCGCPTIRKTTLKKRGQLRRTLVRQAL
jgi:hypothetical protein